MPRSTYFAKVFLSTALLCFLFVSATKAQTFYTIGTGTAANSTTSYPTPFGNEWTSMQADYLYRANELTTAGLTAGIIDKIGFNVTNLQTTFPYASFTIYIKNTTTTALTTTWQTATGLSTFYGPSSAASQPQSGWYQPVTGWNDFAQNASSSFQWDGVSNILVRVCFSNWNTGAYFNGNASVAWTTNVGFNGSVSAFDDVPSFCGLNPTNQIATSTKRPNIRFGRYQPCSSAPTALSITNSPLPVQCSGFATTLSATDPNTVVGITYQWQSSPNGSTGWTNIPGANSLSYVTPSLFAPIYYRATDSCPNTVPHTGASTASYPIIVNSYSIPYVQNFDIPSNFGLTNYALPACMQGNYNLATAGLQTIFAEGFDGTTFPPSGWTMIPATGSNGFGCTAALPWIRVDNSGIPNGMINMACTGNTSFPTGVSTHTGAGMAGYESYENSNGATSQMITPAINFAAFAGSNFNLSFYMYGCDPDNVSVLYNTTPSATGAVAILNNVSVSNCTWTLKSATLPAALLASSTGYLIFKATSAFGEDIFIDDIAITYSPIPRTMWGQLGPNMYHAADGTIIPNCVYANDTVGIYATNGKQDYITTPALPLIQGIKYRAWFGYARGYSNWVTNSGGIPNNEVLYLTVGQNNPGTTASTSPISTFPNPLVLFSTLPAGLTSNSPVPTTANNVTYVAPVSGSYYFSWIDNTPHGGLATTPNGTVALDSIKIDSVDCTQADIVTQPAASTSVCAGFPVTFSVTGSGYGLSYQWFKNSLSNPITGATSSSYTIASTAIADAGNYLVRVSGTCAGPNNKVSNMAALVVNTSPPAVVTSAGSTVICPTTFDTLNANTGSGLSYQWYNSGGIIQGATSSSYAAGLANNYYVVVTSTNTCYTTSNSTNISVLPAPPAVASPAGSTTLCAGNCVTIHSGTGSNLSYQWMNNGGVINGATADSFSACASGIYTVKVTNNLNGCFAISPVTVPVTVNPLPSSLVTASGPDTFCQNQSVTLVNSFVSGMGYQWYNGTTALAGLTTNTYIATQTGNYTLKITNLATGCSSTSAAHHVLLNVPAATVSAPVTSLCAGNSVNLIANAGPGLSYQWYVNGYSLGSAATGQIYTTNVPGAYTVMVTSSAGSYTCSNSSTPPVTLLAYSPPPAFITTTTATTFCAGNSVILHADTGTGFTYTWLLNGVLIPGSGSVGANYTASSSGLYSVGVTNAQGCAATSPGTAVTVIPLPAPLVTASGNTQLCPGGNVTLSTATGPGLSYQWYSGTTLIPGATFPVYVTSSTANYTVVVTNSTACQGTSVPVPVVMNTIPSSAITASGPTAICSGGSLTLNAVPGSGYSYQWLLNGSPISGANGASYQASAAGSYKVIVTNIAAGCSSTTATATNVNVNSLPLATSTSAGPTSVCEGTPVVLFANAGTGLSYQWNNNNIPIAGKTAISDTAQISGSYTVTVTDGNGCSSTSSPNQVAIYSIPNSGLVPNGDTGFCQGGGVLLTAIGGSGYTYQWKKNGTNVAGATSQTYQATVAGSYTVLITNAICNAESPAKNVSVYPLPVDTTALLGSSLICINDSVEIQAIGGNGFSYQWEMNGNPIAGATHSSYWASVAGSYSVYVTSNYGCALTTQLHTITNYPPPNPLILGNGLTLTTGTFVSYQWYRGGTDASDMIAGATASSYAASQSGDYYVHVIDQNNCGQFSPKYTIGNLGVKQANAAGSVKIYPNPATSVIHIEAQLKVDVKIMGIDGRTLIEQHDAKSINISDLADGVYMINVYDENHLLLKTGSVLKSNR